MLSFVYTHSVRNTDAYMPRYTVKSMPFDLKLTLIRQGFGVGLVWLALTEFLVRSVPQRSSEVFYDLKKRKSSH